MIRALSQRLVILVLALFVTSVLIYGALYLAPGDPATLLAGPRATPQAIAEIHRLYHLNGSFVDRYWNWLKLLLHGNLGDSFIYRVPVTSLLANRIVTTVMLVAYASMLILLVGIGLGVVAGMTRRTGTVISFVTSIGLATPSFVAAIVLITLFAVKLGWFPVFGPGSGFFNRLYHLTLPAIALAISWVAFVAQMTKAAVRGEAKSEHVDTARSRGIPTRLVVRRHILRNAMIPVTTVAGLTIAGLIAGDVVVEQAFTVNGVGSLLVQSILQKDFAVVQAISLLIVATFVIVNAAVDVINVVLDPRLRTVART